ncbi:MAG: tetratricopeptide repeat protein [Gemmatimonadaceae bacterium]
MSAARLIGMLALLSVGGCRPAAAQPQDAERLLRTGRYDEAAQAYRALASAPQPAPGARRGLLRALVETGKYDEAIAEAQRLGADAPAEIAVPLGDALAARGRLDEAERAYAAGARGPDALAARLRIGELHLQRGRVEEAMAVFDDFIDVYNRGRDRLTSEELAAVGVAVKHLGRRDPQLFKDALKALDEAVAKDSLNVDAQVALGELFLEKYNSGEAKPTLERALTINPRHPRGLLAAARRAQFDGEPGVADLARKALEVNPHLVAAHALLAEQAFGGEDYDAAAKAAEQGLAVDSAASEALAVLAASRALRGDLAGYEAVRRRALARNPRDADFHVTLAELAARNRLYAAAAVYAAQAVAADSTSWRAHGVLGVSLLRLGKADQARASLERAFAGDPYDPWIKNTLDLLDTFKDYAETRTPRFQFLVDGKESGLLSLYLGPLGEEAFAKLQARYGYAPPTPVRLEVYRSHADFSVRTVGLAGLGALGVSFGSVLAMDSPSARDAGQFNWGSTFWHELAHAFTLGMTDHRVPRWVSEGLSVLEERRARPGWGDGVTPSFVAAYRAGRMPPVSRLNEAFMRPAYPEQVIHGYYLASMVMEFAEQEGGPTALPALLRAYKEGASTPEAFRRALKTDLPAFEKRFDAWLRQRLAAPLASVPDAAMPERPDRPAVTRVRDRMSQLAGGGAWMEAMRKGHEAFAAKQWVPAAAELERAKALFPEYAGDGSPYWLLAQIHHTRGDDRKAAAELAALLRLNGSHLDALKLQADLLEALGDRAGAAAALDRMMYVYPYDVASHERLARLSAVEGDRTTAVRERRAVLELKPVDEAGARYELAVALRDAGQRDEARREVLRALETAPSFEKAQALLLELRSGGQSP